MARLPQVSRELAVTPQIQSSISGADIAAPYQAIAKGIGELGVSLADYQQMVDQGNVAKELDAAKTAALNFTNSANGDAEAFKTSWDTYATNRLSNVPPNLRNLVEQNFLKIGGDTYRAVLGDKFTRDQKIAGDSMAARQDSLTADLADLAQSGQSNTDAYKQKHEELTALISSRVGNPAFAYSQDHANLDLTNIEDTLNGASVTGELTRIYQKDGYAAAQQRAQQIFNDPNLGLSDAQKSKAINKGLTAVRSLYALDAQSRAEFGVDRDTLISQIKDGTVKPDDPRVADLIAVTDTLHDPHSKMMLQQAQAVARYNVMGGMSLDDQLKFLGSGGGMAPGAAATDSAAAIIRQEEGFASTPGWDVNAYRAGYGSDTLTRADGTVVKVVPGTVVSRDDAERDLQRWIPKLEAQNASHIAGWAALPPNVRGALDSVAYNYGDLPASVIYAARTGDPAKIADAVEALGKNAGINNPERRKREAAIIRGGALPSGTGGTTVAAADYTKGVPEAVRKYVTTGLNDALTTDEKIVSSHPLDDQQKQQLIIAARMVDDASTYDKVAAVLAKSDAVAVSLGTPVGDQAAYIDALRAPGATGDDAVRIAVLGQMQAQYDRQTKLLKDDPYSLGIELKMTDPGPPVDWSNVDQAAAIIKQRSVAMGRLEIAEKQPSGSLSPLHPAELDGLKADYDRATAQGKQALIASLTAAMPSDRLMNVLGALAGKDSDGRSLAIAGALTAVGNPEAGAAIIRGEEALKTNPKFGFVSPTQDEQTKINAAFPPSVVLPLPSYGQGWQDHVDAARAAYADLSFKAGDSSGNFNEDRWKKAVGLVTGGILNGPQGQKIIAPIPGMSQQQFDALFLKVTQPYTIGPNPFADTFKGVQWPDGSPISVATIRAQGVLHSVGDGRYAIEIGKDSGIILQQSTQTDSATGRVIGTFELDLKKAATAQQQPARVQDYVAPPAPQAVTDLPRITMQQLHDAMDPALEAAKKGKLIDEQLRILDETSAKIGLSPQDAQQLHRYYDHLLNPDATPSTGNQLQQGSNPLPRGSVQVADASGKVPQSVVDQFNKDSASQFGLPGVTPSDSPLGAIANTGTAIGNAAKNVWDAFSNSRVVQQWMAGWDNPQGINRTAKADRLPINVPAGANPATTSTIVESFANKDAFQEKFKDFFGEPPSNGLTPKMIAEAYQRAKARDEATKSGSSSAGVEGLMIFLNLMLTINQGIAESDARRRAP